ncbi:MULTISPECIES: hypothetical protein [Bifidobacterium]|jgi:hypothetical protein|uniref:Uncharacterized protein n=2 Tax=Bifidobacterium TaxID=1678 RepID=A0A423UC79_9BIFI|nr:MULTISPECIES: hypothetical protein [Bifidobacterium]PKA94574.1 hypothetical protein A9A89_0797 [Bifidobacterium psychraerophilum DSM 22366]ROT86297.1 hypothetical protein BMONG18_1617 [Bifidobacterium mongoliense]
MWLMIILGITVVALIAIASFFGVQNHLSSQAEKLQHGDEIDRETAKALRDISSKMDQGKYLYR